MNRRANRYSENHTAPSFTCTDRNSCRAFAWLKFRGNMRGAGAWLGCQTEKLCQMGISDQVSRMRIANTTRDLRIHAEVPKRLNLIQGMRNESSNI